MGNTSHKFDELSPTTRELDAIPGRHAAAMEAYARYRSYEAVAAFLGVRLGTVKSRIHRGRAAVILNRLGSEIASSLARLEDAT